MGRRPGGSPMWRLSGRCSLAWTCQPVISPKTVQTSPLRSSSAAPPAANLWAPCPGQAGKCFLAPALSQQGREGGRLGSESSLARNAHPRTREKDGVQIFEDYRQSGGRSLVGLRLPFSDRSSTA